MRSHSLARVSNAVISSLNVIVSDASELSSLVGTSYSSYSLCREQEQRRLVRSVTINLEQSPRYWPFQARASKIASELAKAKAFEKGMK